MMDDFDPLSGPVPAVRGPELFFALVYPVGTDTGSLVGAITDALKEVGYNSTLLHLIDELNADQGIADEHKRYMDLMSRGNEFRRLLDRPDAFALYSAALIAKDRLVRHPKEDPLNRLTERHAYIIQSLKRPEEVSTLNDIYGEAFFTIAAHSSPASRRDRLTWDIARSDRTGGPPDQFRAKAEELIARDQKEFSDPYGQRVSDTFPLADVYVDTSHPSRLKSALVRFIRILFGFQFHTPTRDEYGMFHAHGAALRSSDLSRQVGAAISHPEGEIVALGTNEVPKAGGGQYWEGDSEDRRDFTYGREISEEVKRTTVRQILDRLKDGGVISRRSRVSADAAWELLKGTDLLNVGEFNRSVHAEMAALSDATRRGISVRGATLYTTTFPCHVCARHIVAGGISRLVYNEPYPKSLARYLHLDALAVDEASSDSQLPCEPFVGVAPSFYGKYFKAPIRKGETGEVLSWDPLKAEPRVAGIPTRYLPAESVTVLLVGEALRDFSTDR